MQFDPSDEFHAVVQSRDICLYIVINPMHLDPTNGFMQQLSPSPTTLAYHYQLHINFIGNFIYYFGELMRHVLC